MGNILAGHYEAEEIMQRLHALRGAHHTAELKSFAEGQPRRKRLFAEAEQEAAASIERAYSVNLGKRGRTYGQGKGNLEDDGGQFLHPGTDVRHSDAETTQE